MWVKALVIARKDLYLRFTNRGSLLMMLVAPLVLSAIIALVFGDFGAEDAPTALRDIPLAIVNLDEGALLQGQAVNHGADLVALLGGGGADGFAGVPAAACVPDSPAPADEAALAAPADLADLFDARVLDDAAAGRALVERGEVAALVIVPADFSARLAPRIGLGVASLYAEDPAAIEVYSDATRPLESLVARSVVQGYGERLLRGYIALGAALNALIEQEPLAALRLSTDAGDEAIAAALTCGFSDLAVGAQVDARRVTAGQDADGADAPYRTATYILALIGTAQSTFFALFAAQFAVLGVIEERRAGTLQRILTTPTTRGSFLAGKLLGTFVTALVQLFLLLLALSLLASLLEGRLFFIWGTDFPALLTILLPLSLAVSGLGVLLIAFVQRPEQVGPFGSIVNILLAILGGAFGFTLPEPLPWLSLIYWGTDAMNRLLAGDTAVGLNALVLTVQGVALFGVGLWLFRRRVEV